MRIMLAGSTWRLAVAVALVSASASIAAAADGAVPFGVPEPPSGTDPSRMRVPLSEVPGAPELPADTARPQPEELPRQAMRRLEEARRLFAEQRFTETITEVDTVLRYNGQYLEAHRLAALAAMMTGNQDRAASSARQALERYPLDVPGLYVLGRLAEKDRKPQDAMRHYRLALKAPADPGDRPYLLLSHYYLGSLLEANGYFAAAAEQWKAFDDGLNALQGVEPDNPELATLARVQRGQTLQRLAHTQAYLGNYAASAETLGRAVKAAPGDNGLRAELIRMQARAGRMDAAAESAAGLVAETEGDATAVELMLEVHRLAGTPDKAVEALAGIVKEKPDSVPLALLYVDALNAAGKGERANATLKDLLARHPDLAEIRWKLIETQRARGQWRGWITALTEALEQNPESYERVRAEIAATTEADAGKLLAAGGDVWPQPGEGEAGKAAGAAYLRGLLHARLQDAEQARSEWARALELSTGYLPAAAALGEWYVSGGQWRQAVELLAKPATERSEPSAKLFKLLGAAHDGLDNYEPAIGAYNRAIELDPKDAGPVLKLAQLYERIDRKADSQRLYKAAVELDGSDLEAREALVRSLLTVRRAAELGAALQQVKSMQRAAPNAPATIRAAALLELVNAQAPDRDAYLKVLADLVKAHPQDVRSREDYAAMLFAGRDYAGAREQLEALLALDPRNAAGNEMLSLVLMKFLDLEAAGQQFHRMLELHPNRQVWIANLAEYDLIVGNYDEAIEQWRRLLTLDSARPQAMTYRIKLQQTYRLADRFDEARADAQKWLDEIGDEPGRNLMHWFLLAADLEAGDLDQYLARCEKWLKAKPDDGAIRGWYLGVKRDLDIQEIGRAAIQGQVSLQLISGQQFQREGGLIAADRGDEAVVQALHWLKASPRIETAVTMVIDALSANEQGMEGIEMVNSQLAGADPNQRLSLLMQRQELYLAAKRYDDAISAAREVIVEARRQFDRQDLSSLQVVLRLDMGLGAVLAQARQYDAAIEHYSKLLTDLNKLRESGGPADEQLKPLVANVLRMLAFTLQKQGKTDDSLVRMREALELAPLDVGVNNDLGYTLADAGRDLEEAERMIRLAVGEEPRQAAYLDSLGWVLYKKGDFAGARTWLKRATAQENGNDPVVWEHLGDSHWRLGEKQEAVACWKHSLARNEELIHEGEGEQGEEFITRVKGKLSAAESGGDPQVATASQPAAK